MRPRPVLTVLLVCSTAALAQAQQQRDPFAQVFRLPGVEFNQQQQAKIAELRKEYVPTLAEIQEQLNGVYTREQRQARRDAMRAARDAGKSLREVRAEIDKAVNLTEEQKKKLTELQAEQRRLTAAVRERLTALLSDEQRRQLPRRPGRNNAARPQRNVSAREVLRNVKYGPHERNVMDVWLAESKEPTPVLVSIHGGGFRGGNKSVDRNLLASCLKEGISVVAITYRLSDTAIAPAQHLDAARAIQFIRSKAKEWNLDKTRFAATGGSAGAGLSLWLGFHDDMADPDSKEPVKRESTRLTCMAVYNGQSTYDPRVLRELFPGSDTYKHAALQQLYDYDLDKLDEAPPEKIKLFEEVSALTHLTDDDPPALLMYATELDTPVTNQGVGIHHPKLGKLLQQRMQKLDIPCQVVTGVGRGQQRAPLTFDFIKKHLKDAAERE
jgi:acetyl esterase/lipase